MVSRKITLSGREYTIRPGMRAAVYLEQMTGKPFALGAKQTDHILYFYAMVLAYNPECSLTLDEFEDALDDTPEAWPTYYALIREQQAREKAMTDAMREEEAGDKKKV